MSLLKPGEFRTLTGDIWKAHMGVARARRAEGAGRLAHAVAACDHDTCSVRQSCGRFGRASEVKGTWPGGVNCQGFQPATPSPAAA